MLPLLVMLLLLLQMLRWASLRLFVLAHELLPLYHM